MPPLVDRRKYKGIQVRKDRLLPPGRWPVPPGFQHRADTRPSQFGTKGGLSYKIYQHNRRYRILFKVDWLLGPNGY